MDIWSLMRGLMTIWDLKVVAAGRVREVAVGEGSLYRETLPCHSFVAAYEGWLLVRGAVYRGTTVYHWKAEIQGYPLVIIFLYYTIR